MEKLIRKELESQIAEKSKEVHTQSYSMSIGEVINLYKDGELVLQPEFQRFFRWSTEQKVKLIESILLGIPLPSFFVSQRPNGVWDVVDGLQRLSTIFEFMGTLRDEYGEALPCLEMSATRYLPALDQMKWVNSDNPNYEIPESIKIDFKRKKIDVNIILKQSDSSTKYELFERLNTGGSSATAQEVRSAILVRENEEVFNMLKALRNNSDFIETTSLTDNLIDEQFDLELIVRFLMLRKVDIKAFKSKNSNEYLTDELLNRAIDKKYNWKQDIDAFKSTFSLLNKILGSNTFRRYNKKKEKFEGGFVVSAFEIIALGIGYNPTKVSKDKFIKNKIENVWKDINRIKKKWAGRNTSNRLLQTLEYGRKLFQE